MEWVRGTWGRFWRRVGGMLEFFVDADAGAQVMLEGSGGGCVGLL